MSGFLFSICVVVGLTTVAKERENQCRTNELRIQLQEDIGKHKKQSKKSESKSCLDNQRERNPMNEVGKQTRDRKKGRLSSTAKHCPHDVKVGDEAVGFVLFNQPCLHLHFVNAKSFCKTNPIGEVEVD